MSEGSCGSISVGVPLVASTEPAEWRGEVSYTKLRLYAKLFLHFLQLATVFVVLAIYSYFGQYRFLTACATITILNGIFLSWAAYSERNDLLLVQVAPRCCKLLVLIIMYGFFQGLHVKHFYDVYSRRLAVNPKVLDGVILSLPFAFFSMFSFYLLDSSGIHCRWFMLNDFGRQRGWFRWVLIFASWTSICSLAFSVLELDYRVSATVEKRMNKSFFYTTIHFVYRGAEATWRISLINIACIFLRPKLDILVTPWLAGIALCLPVFLLWIIYFVVTLSLRPKDSPRENIFATMIIAYTMIIVNPAHFVEREGFVAAARKLSQSIFVLRTIEAATVCGYIVVNWKSSFPKACHVVEKNIPSEIGPYLLKYEWSTLVMLPLAISVYSMLVLSVRQIRYGITRDLDDAFMALEMVPGQEDHDTVQDGTVQVRHKVRHGLSSFLLEIGGMTGKFFDDRTDAPSELSIERVLGRGTYGVVVLLKRTVDPGLASHHAHLPAESELFAMKLQNTNTRNRARRQDLARRERTIHNYLNAYPHTCINRAHTCFHVPEDKKWYTRGGELIQAFEGDDHDSKSKFNTAIILEYIDGGNLETYILQNAFKRNEQPQDITNILWWIRTSKRLAFDMVDALGFLHEHNIIYRDLKPDNVLLKKGDDGELHACLTDFGFSKMPTNNDNAKSAFVGAPRFAAPEISRNSGHHQPHTPKVDVYSFGVTLYVTLLRTKISCGAKDKWILDCGVEDQESPNIEQMVNCPVEAIALIKQATLVNPESRPTFDLIKKDKFFSSCTYLGSQI